MKTLFGYGSLILPTAAIGNLDSMPDAGKIYRGETDGLLREEAVEKWEEISEEVELLPVKVQGYTRYYSNESPRGGTMLEIFEEEGSWMNGVIYFGLPDDIYQAVSQKEKSMGDYRISTIKRESIEPYIETGKELPEEIDVFVPREDSEKSDRDTDRSKNPTYHARIMRGIEMLSKKHGDEIGERFRKDFLDTTYERIEGEWRKLSKPDKKVESEP